MQAGVVEGGASRAVMATKGKLLGSESKQKLPQPLSPFDCGTMAIGLPPFLLCVRLVTVATRHSSPQSL